MKHSLSRAGALAILAGFAFLGGLAPAASAQTVCYVPGSGTLYRVGEPNTPTRCGPGHVEFQINAAGKPGTGPTGPAGGDLGGSYPDPSVVKIQGQSISANVPANGQVLTFANGSWTPQAPAAATLPTKPSGAFDFSNNNGLVSVGTYNSGNVPVTGAGVRMMWFPAQAAFRAGRVDGTQWDLANLGSGSVGIGENVIANGLDAVAFGTGTTASGEYSTASGAGATASGAFSVAMGGYSTASGNTSVALGGQAVASGAESFAVGDLATASGSHTTAIGNGVKAIAAGSLAMGEATTANGINSTVMGKNASSTGMTGTFVYGDASTATVIGAPLDNSFIVRAQHFWLGTSSTPTAPTGHLIETSTGAYLSTGGTWTNSSDVNRKHGFMDVDGEDVLTRVASMPVSTWSYRTESDSVRHMGPTAQDFRKAFGLGDTEKAIATVDADGVSLAAIKALIQRTTDLRNENAELRAALADMARRLAELELVRR